MNVADYLKRRLFSKRITLTNIMRVVRYCSQNGDSALLFRWNKTTNDMEVFFIEDKGLPLNRDELLSAKQSIQEQSNGGKHVLGN